jgi:hypothetical protein
MTEAVSRLLRMAVLLWVQGCGGASVERGVDPEECT